jgi:hypothetical protein
MNKIYIINDLIQNEYILDFSNNTLYENNLIEENISKYKFEIINKNELIITWSNNNIELDNNTTFETYSDIELFYTDDSYLYFSTNNYESNKNKIKKIYLINSITKPEKELNEQVIINFDNNTIKRIDNTKCYGRILYKKNSLENTEDNFENINKIIVDWNNNGREIFIKFDKYSYIEQSYNTEYEILKTLNLNKKNIFNIPIHIFIHICIIQNWEEIFNDQIKYIKTSGLYDKVEKIHLGILGNIDKSYFNDEKFDILFIDERLDLYELNTINYIKNICYHIDYEIYILYIHTKGVRKAGNEEVIKSWRNMMEYFLIEKFEECINYLNIYDTLGCNAVNKYCTDFEKISINKNHAFHYSGNFWWSKKSYIDKLPFIEILLNNESFLTRYKAENWILSDYSNLNSNSKFGIIFQDNTNTHPYHRYVFNLYKKILFIVKELK